MQNQPQTTMADNQGMNWSASVEQWIVQEMRAMANNETEKQIVEQMLKDGVHKMKTERIIGSMLTKKKTYSSRWGRDQANQQNGADALEYG